MTIGEDRVRTKFNPGSIQLVDVIKQQTAHLIDLCEDSKHHVASGNPSSEANRLWALAQTAYEEAAMWAVKAATALRPVQRPPEYPPDHPAPGDLGSVPT
jgi:hypothetical protein